VILGYLSFLMYKITVIVRNEGLNFCGFCYKIVNLIRECWFHEYLEGCF
jgi:hypothetical protein